MKECEDRLHRKAKEHFERAQEMINAASAAMEGARSSHTSVRDHLREVGCPVLCCAMLCCVLCYAVLCRTLSGCRAVAVSWCRVSFGGVGGPAGGTGMCGCGRVVFRDLC